MKEIVIKDPEEQKNFPFQDFGLPFRTHPMTKEVMRIYHNGSELPTSHISS